MAFCPDGRYLAYSDERKPEIRILDASTGELVKCLAGQDVNTALAWSGDNRLLAAASDNNRVYVWDSTTGSQQAVMDGHLGIIVALMFSPSGQMLASTGWDDTTRLWDVSSGKPLVTGFGRHLNFSPDGKHLGFQCGALMGLWELADRRECRLLEPPGERTAAWLKYRSYESFDYSPDGCLIAWAGGAGIHLWDVTTGKEICHLPIGYHETTFFHPDGRLITYGRLGLKGWPIEKTEGKSGIQFGAPQSFEMPINTGWFLACCSLDGKVFAAANDRHEQIVVFKLDSPFQKVVVPKCPDVMSLALSRDGAWVAAGSAKGNVGSGIWDAQSGRPVFRLPAEKDGGTQFLVAFSPDGRWLLSAGHTDCRLWEVGTWQPGPLIGRDHPGLFPGPGGPIAFSKDSRMLAIARSRERIQLFDVARQRELATLTAPDEHTVSRLAFSPGGDTLAVSTMNHDIRLWDLSMLRRQLAEIGLDWD